MTEYRRLARAALLLSLGMGTAALGGCAGSRPIPTFDLSAPRDVVTTPRSRGTLVVTEPTALAVLNTEKIIVEPAPGQITYLADAQWSDRLPALFQARLLEAFENSSRARSVARPGDRITADFLLLTDIRTFGLQTAGGAEAVVEVSAKIVDDKAGRIVAAKVFSARTAAANSTGPEVARALDQASDQVFGDIVRWAAGY
ncbi:ABC-type transport auxiliary lipoprotein family protein [Ancylobacter lacus]|uniref:ABC-type transport auxiliary lipoprotein family protein n=1 Tax=Ancylobacter lacus TaxID=2579970 RepID=UPI0031B8513A